MSPRPHTADQLDLRLRGRLVEASPLLTGLAGRIVLDASPAAVWTLAFARGKARLIPGRRRAHTVVTLGPDTLGAILDGTESGVDALLGRRLSIRGNLALALRLGAIIGGGAAIHPRPRHLMALGVPTFCLEAGSGPPVVLLHGLGATSASMLPTLQALAVDHRVIAVDLPGFGETGKPVRHHHARYQAAWLLAVLDELGIERAHLVGNSMGGRLAIEVALRAPARVDRIVAFAPAVAFRKPPPLSALARVLRPELAALVPVGLPHAWLVRGLRACFAQPERLADSWYHSAIDEFRRIYATPRGRVALFSAARQIYLDVPHGEQGFWTRLRRLSRPALFVWGALDPLVPVGFARHVAEAVPAATSVIFDDCGHIPQFELPERTHQVVREFLVAPLVSGLAQEAR